MKLIGKVIGFIGKFFMFGFIWTAIYDQLGWFNVEYKSK